LLVDHQSTSTTSPNTVCGASKPRRANSPTGAIDEGGKSPHIGEPDSGVDCLRVATPHLSGKNARACLVSHMGVEKSGRHPAHGPHLRNPGERRDNRFQGSNVLVGNAGSGPGRPSDRVDLAV
jgi:hypothetical protein